MAREYARVLKELSCDFAVIGRSKETANRLAAELNIKVIYGGIQKAVVCEPFKGSTVIVCTPVETLFNVSMLLMDQGVDRILIEKPGALNISEVNALREKAAVSNTLVKIGYNRRFYQSTLELVHRLANETLIAVNFEITEWSHLIEKESRSSEVKESWVLANTSHVIDLVLHVAGDISELNTFTSGSLSWHKQSARFVGAGVTKNDALISYFGYWDGPGRWSAEFVTTANRYILRPMEILQVQKKGSVEINPVENIDYDFDEKFKPGLFLQTKAFLNGDYTNFCSLEEQISSFEIYNRIANY
jgi:predicted dehydrogenase